MQIQTPEILYIIGKEYKMITLPLESYWSKDNPKPKFYRFRSDARRGYVGKWALRNKHLYLTHIEGTCMGLTPDYPPIPHDVSDVKRQAKPNIIKPWPFRQIYLRVLFPNAHVSGQLAYWFTGEIHIGIGRGIKDYPFPFFKKLLIVSIENGKVVSEKNITREHPNKKVKTINNVPS